MMLKDNNYDAFQQKVMWASDPVTKHENQQFYKAFVYRDKMYQLGDVVYVRHFDDTEHMSYLEVYMLWELRGVKYLSVRAYYFPEDTVEGRFVEQGQDEVVCLAGEIVMTCQEFVQHVVNTHTEARDLPELKIVSFSSYCRCCAMRRRLADRLPAYVAHPLFRALGGIEPRYRVLFCREAVHDPHLHRLWKCQYNYKGTIDRKQISASKKLKLNSESNDDSSDASDIQNKTNGKHKVDDVVSSPKQQPPCTQQGLLGSVANKYSNIQMIISQPSDAEDVNVEDEQLHTILSRTSTSIPLTTSIPPTQSLHLLSRRSAGTAMRQLPAPTAEICIAARPAIPSSNVIAGAQNTVPSTLLSSITDIKLPYNFLSSQTTPQQLDNIVKQLSQDMGPHIRPQIDETKNFERKLKYLRKR